MMKVEMSHSGPVTQRLLISDKYCGRVLGSSSAHAGHPYTFSNSFHQPSQVNAKMICIIDIGL